MWVTAPETIETFSTFPLLFFFYDNNVKKLNQFCSVRFPLFVQPSLHKALKLTFLWDIGGLSFDLTIKPKMGQSSMEQTIGVLIPAMFNADF